ncbi:MAG TPA: hypothetical protein VFJ79_05810, partial [Acidimicrobiales bacterium]|nr:hypothetical protein [Acidimicrobiales bacterium]
DRNQKGVRPGTAQDSPPSASQALPPAAEPARAAGSRLWPAGTADHALGPVAWALLGLAAIVVLAAVLVATGVL